MYAGDGYGGTRQELLSAFGSDTTCCGEDLCREHPYQRPYGIPAAAGFDPKSLIYLVGGTGIEPVAPAV
jgi:hypothetical protein